jgi:hypothetical protein
MSASNQGALMDVDEAQIDEGLYSRQLQVSLFMPRDFAYHIPSSMPDMYWAMKVCGLILVDEFYQREHHSNEAYGCFKRSHRGVGRTRC